MKSLTVLLSALVLLCAAGCAPKITSLQRKTAANLASEAQFALTLRDWPRAEDLLQKATALCPDNGEYWLNLGTVRRRTDNLAGARKAYVSAAKTYGAAYKAGDRQEPQLLLQQVYVYSLLGQNKDAQKVLKQARADHPDYPGVRNFTDDALARMLSEPNFKALAL